jgi:hypothetical protein
MKKLRNLRGANTIPAVAGTVSWIIQEDQKRKD